MVLSYSKCSLCARMERTGLLGRLVVRREELCWKEKHCYCGCNGPLAFVEIWSLRTALRTFVRRGTGIGDLHSIASGVPLPVIGPMDLVESMKVIRFQTYPDLPYESDRGFSTTYCCCCGCVYFL